MRTNLPMLAELGECLLRGATIAWRRGKSEYCRVNAVSESPTIFSTAYK